MSTACIALLEIEAWEAEYLQQQLRDVSWLVHSQILGQLPLPGIQDATIVSPFIYSHFDNETLGHLPHVRLIATRSTGYDHIDLDACREHGIAVANVPHYGENTVAEHTFALILALSRKLLPSVERTRRGRFDPAGLQGFDLKDKVLGVIGAGSIGQHVIRMARGFEMQVLAYDILQSPDLAASLNFRYVTLDELLQQADIVTLHAPYRDETHHLVNRDNIGRIKRGAILVNTARGGLIETQALVHALKDGMLAGAGLDVLEEEGLIREDSQFLGRELDHERLKIALENHMLLFMDNVIITPHNAFHSTEARRRILDTTLENILEFLAGRPVNLVT